MTDISMPTIAAPNAAADETSALFRRLGGALLVGLLLLLGIAGGIAWLSIKGDEIGDAIASEMRMDLLVTDLQSTLRQAESGMRGFFITGEEPYLAATRTVRTTSTDILDTIASAAHGDPEEAAPIARMREFVAARIDQLDRAVAALRIGDREGARAIIADDRNEAVRRDMNAEIGRMRELQRADVARQRAVQGRNRTVLLAALGAALLGVLATGVLAAGFVRRATVEIEARQASLQTLAASLEDQVAERTAKLTEANREIQRFAYIVSHDLRSPLVNIMGFTDELGANLRTLDAMVTRLDAQAPGTVEPDERIAIAEDIPEALGFIKASTAKMDRLINAILRLSREGRRPLTAERLDLDALVAQIVLSLDKQAEARGAMIAVEALPAIVNDRLAIEQVLSNLLENAIKYGAGERENRITVSGRREGGRVLLDVADTGRGIAPEDHARVFELFRRAGRQDQPGEGLGLAFVQALVRRLGGVVTVAANPGGGSVFRVDLPYAMPLDVKKG